mgnify:CR=1 FL=1
MSILQEATKHLDHIEEDPTVGLHLVESLAQFRSILSKAREGGSGALERELGLTEDELSDAIEDPHLTLQEFLHLLILTGYVPSLKVTHVTQTGKS